MKVYIPCLNRRVVTFKDAIRAAKKLKVKICFLANMENDGYYLPPEKTIDGKPYIIINSSMTEQAQTRTIVHELTHHVCHWGLNLILVSRRKDRCAFYDKQESYIRSRHEFEAEAIEAISLLPAKDLRNATRGLFEVDDIITDNVWSMRLLLRRNHKI